MAGGMLAEQQKGSSLSCQMVIKMRLKPLKRPHTFGVSVRSGPALLPITCSSMMLFEEDGQICRTVHCAAVCNPGTK